MFQCFNSSIAATPPLSREEAENRGAFLETLVPTPGRCFAEAQSHHLPALTVGAALPSERHYRRSGRTVGAVVPSERSYRRSGRTVGGNHLAARTGKITPRSSERCLGGLL